MTAFRAHLSRSKTYVFDNKALTAGSSALFSTYLDATPELA